MPTDASTSTAHQAPNHARLWLGLLLGVFLLLTGLLVVDQLGLVTPGNQPRLSDRLSQLPIEQTDAGPRITIRRDGQALQLTPDQYIADLYNAQQARQSQGLWFRLFDITSPTGFLWIAAGLGAQALFTARMLVQWLASEKAKASVVPVAFWWLSLTGATMLLMYFLWRGDIVGILGQTTGWVVYVRNLWLIHQSPEQTV